VLPRGPLFQGLVSGLAGAIGYSIGVFAVWLVRFMLSRTPAHPAPRRAWLALIVIGRDRHGRDGDLVPRLAGPGAPI